MENREVLRGDLQECLKHFALALEKRYKRGLKGTTAARKPMADFCGISESTLNRWLYTECKPKGMEWFRLCIFLELQGYRVTEWWEIEDNTRNYAEMVVFGIYTVEQLVKKLGYAETSPLYDLLRGQRKATDKLQILWELYALKANKLERLKERAAKKFVIDVSETDEFVARGGGSRITTQALAHLNAHAAMAAISCANSLLYTRPLDRLSVDELKELNEHLPSNVNSLKQLLEELLIRLRKE